VRQIVLGDLDALALKLHYDVHPAQCRRLAGLRLPERIG